MHATPTTLAPPPTDPADFTTHLATKLQQAQEDALDTIHKTMLRLAATIDAPSADGEPADPKTTTQRIRLCLQAARDLLRFKPPAAHSSDDDESPSPRSGGEGARRLCGGRMRVPSHAPDQRAAHARAETPPTTQSAQAAPLLAAAGAGASRFGERILSSATPDTPSACRSEAQPSIPESAPSPRDSSLVAHNFFSPSARSVLTRTSPPDPPQVADEDRRQIIEIIRARGTLPIDLYEKLQSWSAYAQATNLPPPFGITAAQMEAASPHKLTTHPQGAG